MTFHANWDPAALQPEQLAVFILNVGHGDSLVIRFPRLDPGAPTICGVVDCYLAWKTRQVLESLGADQVAFLCATHPHKDHMLGFQSLVEWCRDPQRNIPVAQFWDSGFRHVTKLHYDLIRCLQQHSEISFLRIASGFELTINNVRVQALAPSIRLRNRYDTFGTNINNSSIVLKLEYPAKDMAKYYAKPNAVSDEALAEEEKLEQNTMILGGDAQFESWAHQVDEFPQQSRYATDNRGILIPRSQITHAPLRAQVLKVPHHMSKNGISYEILETIRPKYALVSCSSTGEHTCPHPLTRDAADEAGCGTYFTGNQDGDLSRGSLAVLMSGDGGTPQVYAMGDTNTEPAPI